MPPFMVDLEVLRDAVRERSLSQVGESLLQTKITSPLKIAGFAFTPTAGFDVRVFNRAEDKDVDAVIGDENAHIPFAMPLAWVKYTLGAKTDGRIGFAPVAVGASREVALSDYRIHEGTDPAFHALTGDLESPRTLLDLDDVRQLAPGEALRMELGGTLSASVSFSWSDVLSTQLSDILSELPVSAPVSVKLKNGLETTASVRVTDQFSVVISRTKDGHFRLAVKKAASRSHMYSVEAAVGLEVSAMPAIDEVLDPLFAAILSRLDPAQRIEKAASGELNKLRDTLRKKLADAAKWKASTGFAYEYARIEENTSIADFVLLDETQLAQDYALVLDGDFAKITEALRASSGTRSLLRYLNQSTLTRRSSFGFSLGIGNWARVQARDESLFRQTTRKSLDGQRLIVSQGTRRYEEKRVPENDFEWVVDLKAEMTNFAEAPTTLDFDYGLHLMATLDRERVDEADLERMADFAGMWGVQLPPLTDFAEAIGKTAQIRVQLLFERDALAAAVAEKTDVTSWAEPLAMAMPYMSRFAERQAFAARRTTYTAAWTAWLNGQQNIALSLKTGIKNFEKKRGPGSFHWTSGEGHAQLRRRLDAFVDGVQQLHTTMTTAQAPEAIGDAFDALQQFWSQRLYVAAVGRWLLDRAPTARRSLQIDLGKVTITV